MKSLRMRADRSLYFKECPMPSDLAPDDVLIRMAYVVVSGLEVLRYRGKSAPPKNEELGYNGSGVVVEVGSRVLDLQPGDHVAIRPNSYCGVCDACRSNRPQFCTNAELTSGLMTEYVAIHQKQIFRLPDEVSLRAGSQINTLMIAMEALGKANYTFGQKAIILGCGGVGQMLLKLAQKCPYAQIVVMDPHAEKRQKALLYGADHALDSSHELAISDALMLTDGAGYDAVFEVSGNTNSAQTALNLVARGGTVVYTGLYGMSFDLKVNLMNMYVKNYSIQATPIPSASYLDAIMMARQLNLDEIISAVYPFEDAEKAFNEKNSKHLSRVLLEFPRT